MSKKSYLGEFSCLSHYWYHYSCLPNYWYHYSCLPYYWYQKYFFIKKTLILLLYKYNK